jgi:hypothetical protein
MVATQRDEIWRFAERVFRPSDSPCHGMTKISMVMIDDDLAINTSKDVLKKFDKCSQLSRR